MIFTQAEQVEILKGPSRSRLVEKMRAGLMQACGDDEDAAAARLLQVLNDSALVGLIYTYLDRTEFEAVATAPMTTLYVKSKVLTPPSASLRKELLGAGVPLPVVGRVLNFMDFRNFKHHVAALVLVVFLVEVFK
jgi:hypothetical protein